MKTIDEVIAKHEILLEKSETQNDSNFIDEIVSFLDLLAGEGSTISDTQQRSQLRGLMRFWSSYIYDHTSEFPDKRLLPFSGKVITDQTKFNVKKVNLDEAFAGDIFLGRKGELGILRRWIVSENCHLVSITGIGGIGKSSLAVKLVDEVKNEFDFVIWRNFINGPSFEDLINDLLKFLLESVREIPDNVDEKIDLLLRHLKDHRCLIVFDNLETILKSGDFAGKIDPGYKNYNKLITAIGETPHRSCLLITTREKLNNLALIEGKNSSSVKSLSLSGLSEPDIKELLKNKKLSGSNDTWDKFVNLYNGNPLAIKIIAQTIAEIFDGNIARFMDQKIATFGALENLISDQFLRLNGVEKSILFWLVINRRPVSIEDILSDIAAIENKADVLNALSSLQRRSFIEFISGSFTLQPVVMESLTNRFVDFVSEEIINEKVNLLKSHSIIKADSLEYIRNSQIRIILGPITNRLKELISDSRKLKSKLFKILDSQKRSFPPEPSYLAGNIINLLCHLKSSINRLDFSNLSVWQADLSGFIAQEIDFSFSDLSRSKFSETLGSVLALAFSPNGNLLATGSTNGVVNIWDIASDKIVASLNGHTDWIRAVEFSHDGNLLVSCGDDQTLRIWDVNEQTCIKIIHAHVGRIWASGFSFDDGKLVSAGDDHQIKIWDVESGEHIKTLEGHIESISSISFAPDGQYLASGGEDKMILVWEIDRNHKPQVCIQNDASIRSIRFSPDGGILAVCDDNSSIQLWDIRNCTRLGLLEGHTARVWSIDFSSDGKHLVSGSEDNTIKLWSVATNECLMTLHGHNNQVIAVKFDPKNETVASASDDRSVRLWDISTGVCKKVIRGYANHPVSLSFNSSSTLLASCSDDQIVRLWKVSTGKCIGELNGHSNRVWSVDFSPDDKFVASGSEDKSIRLWNIETKECTQILRGHTDLVWPIKFHPSGKLLASGSSDETVKLWIPGKKDSPRTLYGHSGPIWTLSFSPNGNILASGGDDKTIRLWDISELKCVNTLNGHSNLVWSLVFNTTGNILVSASADKTIKLWDTKTGHCISTLEGHEGQVTSVSVSPNNKMIASGCTDNNIYLWEFQSRKLIKILQGHSGPLWSVVFSPNGKYLASCSDDGTIKLWDYRKGVNIKSLRTSRPYEGMNLSGVLGLSENQISTLMQLGAITRVR